MIDHNKNILVGLRCRDCRNDCDNQVGFVVDMERGDFKKK